MKRIITLIIAVCMTVSLAACDDKAGSSKKDSSSESGESVSSSDKTNDSADSADSAGENRYKKKLEKTLEKAGVIDKPYAHALDDYFKALEHADAELLMKCTPFYKTDHLKKTGGADFDVDAHFEELADHMQELLEEVYGDNIKITYEIKDEKELSQKKLDSITQEIKDSYEADVTVESAYKVKILARIKGDYEDDADTSTITVAKIDGEWYIFDGGYV